MSNVSLKHRVEPDPLDQRRLILTRQYIQETNPDLRDSLRDQLSQLTTPTDMYTATLIINYLVSYSSKELVCAGLIRDLNIIYANDSYAFISILLCVFSYSLAANKTKTPAYIKLFPLEIAKYIQVHFVSHDDLVTICQAARQTLVRVFGTDITESITAFIDGIASEENDDSTAGCLWEVIDALNL